MIMFIVIQYSNLKSTDMAVEIIKTEVLKTDNVKIERDFYKSLIEHHMKEDHRDSTGTWDIIGDIINLKKE